MMRIVILVAVLAVGLGCESAEQKYAREHGISVAPQAGAPL